VSNSKPMNVCDGLESQLNSLTDYFKQWKMKVNAEDTGLQGDFLALELYLTARKSHGLWRSNTWE
jgi:hypothetical protein